MNKHIQIREVMTNCPHSIGVDQSVKTAKQMLRQYSFRHLPVQDGGKLVGIISDRDIQFASGWAKDDNAQLEVKDILTPEPYIVEPTAKVSEIAAEMAKQQYGCVLVAEHGKLVGIFTTTDACRLLAEYLGD